VLNVTTPKRPQGKKKGKKSDSNKIPSAESLALLQLWDEKKIGEYAYWGLNFLSKKRRCSEEKQPETFENIIAVPSSWKSVQLAPT
jgi:hypothetical protein